MAFSPGPSDLAELAGSPSAGFPLPPAATEATAAAAAAAAAAARTTSAPVAAAGAVTAGAAFDQQPSELDQGALQQVFIRLPRNVLVLAAKVLNKGWRDWVYHQLGNRRGKQVVIEDDDMQSSYVPLWSIRQQVGLWTNIENKALLASGAAARGELEDLQWMISQGYGRAPGYKMGVAAAAAEAGQLRVLECLLSEEENGMNELDEGTSAAAGRGGQLRVLQWLRQKGCPWNAELVSAAIEA